MSEATVGQRAADNLQQAVALHCNGRLVEAQRLYEAILRVEPRNFNALHLLGVLAAQTGNPRKAVELIDQAIAIDPGNAVPYSNRGAALRQLRQLEAARESYDQAIALQPDYADAHREQGNVLRELGQSQAALASYERAIRLRPGDAEAYFQRGNAQHDLHDWHAALASFWRATQLRRGFAEAHLNRGAAFRELGDLDGALEEYGKAIAANPEYAEAHFNRANALLQLRQMEPAISAYERAVAIRPDYAQAHFNLAVAELLVGRFERGWRGYEWRWKLAGASIAADRRLFRQPLWLGNQPLAGRTLLLIGEQGLGDTLQFCRYAPAVAALGARVLLEVPATLAPLLRSLDGVSEVFVRGEPLPSFDCYCPLMSLPLACGTSLLTIPSAAPYLRPDARKTLEWQQKLGDSRRLRVGLVWSGGFRPHQPEVWAANSRRNVPLSKFAALRHPSIEFYSLQKGEPAESELARLIGEGWDGPQLRDLGGELHDFSDTAALVQVLDLVITVDTAIAHLAGALARPVWILNHFDACWRWQLGRSDSPWYPSATLYRQRRAGDWDEVVEAVRNDLHAQVGPSVAALARPEQR